MDLRAFGRRADFLWSRARIWQEADGALFSRLQVQRRTVSVSRRRSAARVHRARANALPVHALLPVSTEIIEDG